MGFPVLGPTYNYGDNMSVINNNKKTEYKLKKNRFYILSCSFKVHWNVGVYGIYTNC